MATKKITKTKKITVKIDRKKLRNYRLIDN
jgi:hypothetical protein